MEESSFPIGRPVGRPTESPIATLMKLTLAGVLALGEFGMQAAGRIEALRVVARCRGALGEAEAALAALKQGASEAKAPGYAWLEAKCLEDSLQWLGADERSGVQLQAELDAVSVGFRM